MERRRIIRDQIHGFIWINDLEYQLIQHPFLRRLHGIKQLGMAHLVFPGATHTRFNHSLGVMHIAGRVAEVLVRQARRGEYCGRFFLHCDRGMNEFIEIARLAGLLHDLGHPPLSHQLEESLETVDRMRSIKHGTLSITSEIKTKYGGALHEAFTKHFIERLANDLESQGKNQLADYIRAVAAALGAGPPDVLNKLGIREDALDVLQSIISGPVFDADRLDYLLRDARMSGVVFGDIDIERLLLGLQLEEQDGKIGIGVHPRSMQTLEDIFDARYKMYKTVYYHHKLIAINISITKILELLVNNWEDVAPKPLLDGLNRPEDLYYPEKIADLILNGYTLYTDSDFDMVLYNMAQSKDSLMKRWANSLLADRRLIPITLAKRPEALIIEAASKAGLLSSDDNNDIDKIIFNLNIYLINNIIKNLKNRLKHKILSYIKNSKINVSYEDIIIDIQKERIVKNNKIKNNNLISKNLYINFISKIGKIMHVYPYIYSDRKDIHLEIYKNRNKIRRLYEEEVYNAIRDYAKS